jgi:hypothetical protein
MVIDRRCPFFQAPKEEERMRFRLNSGGTICWPFLRYEVARPKSPLGQLNNFGSR